VNSRRFMASLEIRSSQRWEYLIERTRSWLRRKIGNATRLSTTLKPTRSSCG